MKWSIELLTEELTRVGCFKKIMNIKKALHWFKMEGFIRFYSAFVGVAGFTPTSIYPYFTD